MAPAHPHGNAPVPLLVNRAAGNAAAVKRAVGVEPRLRPREVLPGDIGREVGRSLTEGAECIAVAGGDGTVGAAAEVLAGTGIPLAIIPSGTLNHLARDLEIPVDPEDAARLISRGVELPVDLGAVGDRAFVNTSSIGMYVNFVRRRDSLEHRWGYRLASMIAAARTLPRAPRFRVEIELEGEPAGEYVSSLIFIGVGERELRVPMLGKRVRGGERALHVLVVHGITRARVLALGFTAAARGVDAVARESDVESFLVEHCRIHAPHVAGRLSVDGEVIEQPSPFEYSLRRSALRVLVPEGSLSAGEAPR